MPEFNKLRIQDINQETSDCISIAFEVPENLQNTYQFIPGQYLTLKTNIDGESVRRSYSICSDTEGEMLRVAIKRVAGGRFSTFAHEQLKVGQWIEVMSPMGKFYSPLSVSNQKHYLAFAAGSGITPILSLLKATLRKEPKSNFTLFYGNRTIDTTIFREELENLKNEYLDRLSLHYIFSQEKLGSPLFTGRINRDKCRRFFETLIDVDDIDEVFICGPEAMTLELVPFLEQAGINHANIRFELFTASTPKMPEGPNEEKKGTEQPSNITINLDGDKFDLFLEHGETVLDAALKNGADLPYSCKGGVCCTCKAKLIDGQVDMAVNYGLEPDELEAGYILTCQSRAKTKYLLIDFDA